MFLKRQPLAAALSVVLTSLLSLPLSATAFDRDPAVSRSVAEIGTAPYTIVLREPALASYRGHGQFAAPARIANGRQRGHIDLRANSTQVYLDHLAQQQSGFVASLGRDIGRRPVALFQMRHAINGLVVELSAAEAAQIAARSDVALVEREQILAFDADELDPGFIGADQIWDGSATGGVSTQGEGILVGIIDSGINWQSPSFAATSPRDGYQHINPFGAGQYLGSCGALAPNPDLGRCNDKLVGMYNFGSPNIGAVDTYGHGSHTAGIAVGNRRMADIQNGSIAIAGVAPRANVIAYSCLSNGGCSSTSALLSANQAVLDGVNVLNYSVAGGELPWSESVSLAFLGATEAGIFVAAAAGNDGPDPQSIGHIEPWVATVAASTLDHASGFDFSLHLPGGAPASTQHLGVHPGAEPMQTTDILDIPIVRSPAFDDISGDGCSAFAPGTFTRNGNAAIAVLALNWASFSCGSGQRQSNAIAAGAAGVIFVDDSASYLFVGVSGQVWTMLMADWLAVWNAIQGDPAHATASIKLPLSMYPHRGDRIPSFSGMGPTRATALNGQHLLKPDLAAPGVAILASGHLSADDVVFMDGTSMAAPHIAGAAALMRALRPDWTPMEIKSALMSTASTRDLAAGDGSTTTPWAYGAGRVDLIGAARAGLVLDETGAKLRASDPALGGILRELNLPSFAFGSCSATNCGFSRVVRNPLTVAKNWQTQLVGLDNASVSPASFTLAAGASQEIIVSIDPATIDGLWKFGALQLIAEDSTLPDTRLPIAIKRDGSRPMFVLSTLQLAASIPIDNVAARPLKLSNPGNNGAVRWSVDFTGNGCSAPAWASFSPLSGTLLSGSAPRNLTISFNSQGLSAGTYSGTLCVASDDADMPLTRVELSLEVRAVDTIFANGFEN